MAEYNSGEDLDEVEDSLGASIQLDKATTDKLLKENAVSISRNVNGMALMPYLIQNDCISDDEVQQFSNKVKRSENNMKLRQMIKQRGVNGFTGFMRALEEHVRDEPGEGAHIELLKSLKKGVRRLRFKRQSTSGSSVKSDTHTTVPMIGFGSIPEDSVLDQGTDTVEPDNPQLITRLTRQRIDSETKDVITKSEEETEQSTQIRTGVGEEEHQLVEQDTSNHDQSREYLELKEFKYVLRCSVLFTCICFPVLLIGGIILLTLSIVAFSNGDNCSEVVAPHALTVFNFLYGLLCLATPGIMIMLTVYYCCENQNKKWEEPFKVMSTKCLVVGTTIVFFLILLILIVTELLYSLVYVAPQVYSQYGNINSSDCKNEVYITTFSLLNFSGALIFILLTVLGVYLSVRYFAWVTDPHKQGTLKKLILVILPAGRCSTNNSPPTNSA